jgi:putative ABC transport system ATP-binding protein
MKSNVPGTRPSSRSGIGTGVTDGDGNMSEGMGVGGTEGGGDGRKLVIQTRGLRKDYVLGAETIRALQGVDLEIREGEFVAMMGPSGSGKSTFMNLIGCLDTPTAGEYWLNGQDVSRLSETRLARIRNQEIGFVFQTFNLLPRATALHNVELPLVYAGVSARERRARAMEKLEMVGLADRTGHKPPELSGGQRQRVAVARALINNPALLLADEPTGNLDSRTGEEIMETFIRLNDSGQTIVLVTHEHDIAEYAKRQVHLRDGIIEKDFVNEVRRVPQLAGAGQDATHASE